MNGVDGLLSRYPNVLILIERDKLMSDGLSVNSNSNTGLQMKTACSTVNVRYTIWLRPLKEPLGPN